MQQMTLQFDGFAQVQQPLDVTATKQRTAQALDIARAASLVKAFMPSVILFAKAALCVASAFGFMFFAAIIGG